MPASDDFQTSWRERLASGSKLAARALSQALRDDVSRLEAIANLASDPSPNVRVNALRALAEHAAYDAGHVAPYAQAIVQGLGAPEPDAQQASLVALGHIAHFAPDEVALALPMIADLLKAKRPALREEAARCVGHIGVEAPACAGQAAHSLTDALVAAKSPRAANEAREILGALQELAPSLGASDKAALAVSVQRLRGHPNLQVRERAGRLVRDLAP